MEIITISKECPVCGLGPVGYMTDGSDIYLRCVDCTSYWRFPGEAKFDNNINLAEGVRGNLRPASVDQILALCDSADMASRWSHAGGHRKI